MLNMRYIDGVEIYQIEFKRITEHIVEVRGKIPVQTSGFYLSRIDKDDNWDYTGFATVYRETENGIQFSDNQSVYVEPLAVITFEAEEGGKLEGQTVQEVKGWADVEVPTPIPYEGYVFTGWAPALPEDEEINATRYIATFKGCYIRFIAGEGGFLEGETRQPVHDYSELDVPKAIPYKDYDFVGWSEEIPESGIIDMDKLEFVAVFKSNLPERVASLEGDMMAFNKALEGV